MVVKFRQEQRDLIDDEFMLLNCGSKFEFYHTSLVTSCKYLATYPNLVDFEKAASFEFKTRQCTRFHCGDFGIKIQTILNGVTHL